MKRKMWWLKRYSTPHLCARYLMLFCALGFVLLPTSYVWANPAGEQVVGGAATFQRDGNKLTVNQATDRLAVNWQSFNIGAGESTHFNMPSSTSAALNRVIGGNPSSIYGSLSANGILYLINPSGILVGPGGTVNAAAFMASTLDVSTEQFMNAKNGGAMNFVGSSGESIINQGNITAEKGDVFLVAQKVENRGTINAANGTAGMVGSGQNTDVMVHEVGGKGFAIRVAQLQGEAATGSNRDLPDGEELLNEGSINAAQAELNASGNVYALAIRNSGTIRAKAVVANADGTVRLDGGLGDVMNTGTMIAKNSGNDATAAGGKIDIAGQNITASPESIITAAGGEQSGNGGSVKIDSQDTTIVQGKVDVTAPSAGAKGGKVQLLGEKVGMLDGAKVDASGGAGGGTVLVGGDYLGGQTPRADLKNLAKQEAESVKNAKAVVMADTAEIKADATVSGDGGKIVLWSDEYTGFFGDLFARGGVEGGNGGFIETSSKDNLQAMGAGIASAANGAGGLWLLDPSNLEISSLASSGGSFNSGNPNVFTPDGTANTAVVNNGTIQNSLNAGTDVTLLTSGAAAGTGDITMTAGISKDATVSGTASTLTMIAAGSINISQAIVTTDGGLSLVLGAQSGVTIGANITTLGGNLTIQGAAADGASLAASTTTVTISSGTVSTLGGSGSGNLSITATGAVNQADGTLSIKGTSTITTGGATITLTQAANDFTGAVSLNNSGANNVAVTDANAIVLGTSSVGTGTLTVTATGANSITQSGAITQAANAGLATFTTGAGVITLTQTANDFTGAVSLNNSGANNVAVTDANAIILGTSGVGTGTLAVNAVGIQQAVGTTITQTAGAGTATFNAGAGVITLVGAGNNNFTGAVSLNNSGANAVAVTDANALILGTSSVGTGTFTVTATGANSITQIGAITQRAGAGLSTFTTGTGVITLTQANDFTGAVSLNNSGANNVAVTDANAIILGASSLGTGTLTVNAVGITQTSALTVSGVATFNSGIGSIDLSEANDFTGSVSLTGGNTIIRNNSGLIFGTSTISGSLQAFATAGTITQTGSLSVSNGATFNAATGQAITLAHLNPTTGLADNSFLGGISFIASTGNLSNITLVATTPVEIQSNLNITGNLSVTANGIAQSGVITVGGTSAFNGGTGAIVLANTGNTYGGTVTVSGGASADMFFRLADEGDVGPVTVAGTFTLRTATGTAFNLAGVGGTANFDVTDSILGNLSVGTLALVANGAAISSSSAYSASGVENLSLTTLTSGAITLGATVTTGDLQLNSAGGNIAASDAANDFTGTVSASTSGTSTISITDINDLTLGVISLGTGILGLTFGKDLLNNLGLGLEGRIIAGGAVNLTPNQLASDILLGVSAGNANDIAGAVTIINNVNVRDFVLRNVNSAAGTIVNLAGATNLRDVSINYPSGTYSVPTFASTSFRNLSVYANTVTLGGAVTSNNGGIELYQANSAGTFTLNNNVNTLSGDIRILSDGALTVSAGVVIGGQTTGAITLSADAGGVGTGALTLTGPGPAVGAVVGNANNSSVITLQSASVVIGATSSILQGAGTVVLKPSTLDADIDLGTVAGGVALFSITGTELGRIFSSGTVEIGGESQVGNTNIGAISLTASTFSTLKLVGSSASSAFLGADAGLRTFGIGLDFDINVDLEDNLLVIDTTQAGFYPIGADIRFGKQVDSDRTLAVSDGRISLTAGTVGNVEFVGTVGGINPVQFLQVTSGNEVTVGRVTARVGGANGPGGLVSLTGNSVTVNGVLNVDAITTAAGPGEAGGQVLITGRDVILNNRVTANGGDGVANADGANFGGGSAGEIDIRATDSLSVNPTPDAEIGGSFSALGGDPSGGNAGFGADGIIQLASDRDLYFTANQEAERETQYSISAGRDLIFASFLNTISPSSSVGGVSFRMNVNNTEVSRVNLNLAFAQTDSAGILYMAPGSTIQMNGGTLSVNKDQNLTTGKIEFANIDVVNSPSFGLTYTGTSQLKFSGSISGSNTQGGSGAVVSISAGNADFVVLGGITVNGDDGVGGQAGYVSVTAKSIQIGEIQANGGGGSGSTGRGGNITLETTTGGIKVGSIYGQGGIEDTVNASGGFGGSGGDVILLPGGLLDVLNPGRGALEIGTINVSGGACADPLGVGGKGGNITIEAAQNIYIPSNMFVGGGEGDQSRGAPGLIDISTTFAADIALGSANLVINGTGDVNLTSARNFILGTVDFTDLDTISAGSLTLNDGAVAGDTLGQLKIAYGSVDATGQLLMPSSSTIDSNGGSVTVTGNGAQAQVGSIFTVLDGAAGGAIDIDAGTGLLLIGGFLFTQGSDAAAGGNQGLAGGSITLQGSSVSVGSINTSAGGSSSTARLFGRGGQGGNVSITATGVGGQITLQDDLLLTGGKGLSTRDGIGGSGGRINLTGNVVIDSGSSLKTQITLNTAGGTGLAAGGSGSGGAIVVTGSLTGTSTTSNTLQLSHGSGAVTLGAVTLSELITADATGVAADSTGAVTINGALNLTTLTTQGFGYSLSILGGGSIANRVTFLNTGTTSIGAAGVTTTFTDGFDALTGTTAPSTLLLGGTINTVTATTGSMLASTTQLIADTTLNSAGNSMEFGSLDGTYNLTLAAGVAEGTATFNGAVGDTTELGQITITGGIDNQKITLANFLSTVKATGITSGVNSNLTFNNDVTLNNPDLGITTDLGGTITFNNQAYLDDPTAKLSFLGSGNKRISGATTLSGGPIEFGGLGEYTVTGTIDGAQNLILSGLGTKTFTGTVGGTTALGSVTGGEEAIVISGGNVAFGSLITVNGIVSTDAKVTFSGVTTLGYIDKNSSLASDVDLLGATLTSAGTIDLGDAAADSIKLGGVVLVNGAGAVTVKGAVTDNAGFTSFTQAGTAGKISFDEDVTLDVANGLVTLNGNVGLSGMSFSTVGTVTLGNALTDSITLATAAVTLTGTGTFAVNGVVVGGDQNLTLSGAGGKTFAGALSGLGTLALTAGTGTFNSTISGIAFNQSGGVSVLNRSGTFTGASTLGGTSTTLNGITFTSGTTDVTGALTTAGATTLTGGLITLNTASDVTSSSGLLTMGSAVSIGQGATLTGAGAYKLSGTVNGANSLTLNGAGAKTFSGAVGTGTALTTITQNDASGLVTFAEDVTMSGAGTFNQNLVLAGLTMTSTGSTLTFGNAGTDTLVISGAATIQTAGKDITLNSATTLNAALTMSDLAAAGGITTLSGVVTGKSSNLTITTDDLVVGNTVQTGSGVVSLTKKDGLALTVGGVAPGFLNATEISRISTSGGLTLASGGNITIDQLVIDDTDQITGAFRMVTTGGGILVNQSVQLNELSGFAAGALTATGGNLSALLVTKGFRNLTLGAGGLEYFAPASMTLSGVEVPDDIIIGSVNSLTVNGSVASLLGNIDLGSGGDIQVSSRITAPDTIIVDSDRYFINSFTGNPFQSSDVRIVTSDLFGATWPSNGAVPGLQVVYGVNSIGQVGANQIGVSTTLLAGNAAPYILEFTTGTGQPYIFAQQAAIPPVMMPAALTGGNGFAKTISYSADEIEMMTPEERSAYENQQRQVSARVILQGQSGEGEEIGAPTEGRTPQAAIPAVQIPVAPTAQVLLEGKPLAGAKSDQERGDAKRILKVRPTRAVAVRSGFNVNEMMESERMAAEVSVGSAPVVQSR